MSWIMLIIFYGYMIEVPRHTWRTEQMCNRAAAIVSSQSAGMNNLKAFCIPKD